MKRSKNTAERGKFKQEIHSALYKSVGIQEIIFGDDNPQTPKEKRDLFKKRVESHLFIDDTIQDTSTYIFYDVVLPRLGENIKTCRVVLYIVCHRENLDNYSKEGYYGNRADILSQMVEDCLINDEEVALSFGIGRLTLDSVDVYNSKRHYGCVMTFSVPNFR